MKAVKRFVASGASALVLLLQSQGSLAQQITGEPGSPTATTTVGKQLPPPDPAFGGVIKEKASESKPGGRRASCRPRVRPTYCSS